MSSPPVLLDDNGEVIPTCSCCGMRVMRVVEGSCWPPPCLYACPDCDLRPAPPDTPWQQHRPRPHN